MANLIKADIAVIGAGSGGLSVAAGASQMGANVVLFERHKMGGDCLNFGCVPSKSLLAAGHFAQAARDGEPFGVMPNEPTVAFDKVNGHVHQVIGAIAPNDSVERFEGFGVNVIQADARFVSPSEVVAGDQRVQAKRFVIATGSSAAIPPIPGLERVPFLTNETIFDLTECPLHLLIIGGGPIGIEMAQAHRRLGAKVTLMETGTIMGKDDPETVDVVRRRVREEGVTLREGVMVVGVEPGPDGGVTVTVEEGSEKSQLHGTHLLVAAGRKPNLDGLGLDEAGIEYTRRGVTVDARLRSTNKRVFAIGDAAGGYQFTHVAGYHAGIVIRNALFLIPAKAKHHAVPWVTYTDPEVAHVGLQTHDPISVPEIVEVLKWSFEENDRAQAERETEGMIKVAVGKGGRVLGATIVGPHAGELILPWVIAVDQKMKIGTMASIIAPYPTLSEVSKRVAGSYYTEKLFSERTRSIVRFLQKFVR